VGATYAIELTPEAQAVCNNSPVFDEVPPTAICAGFPFVYDHSATDVEGDSLVYSFCPLLAGGGPNGTPGYPGGPNGCNGVTPNPPCAPPFNTIPLNPGFTQTNPMGGNPALSIDSLTGIITGTPVVLGQYFVAVCVAEYRNDTLLSISQRDCQFTVVPCQSLMNATIQSTAVVQDTLLVSNCGVDAVLTNQSTPVGAVQEFVWSIVLSPGDTLVFSGQNPLSPNWSPSVTFPGPGIYSGQLALNPSVSWCSDTTYFQVVINQLPTADFTFSYDTCVAGPVQFTELCTPGSAPVTNFYWLAGEGGSATGPNPAYQYNAPGVWVAVLTITDSLGCTALTADTVTWYPVPPTIILVPTVNEGCAPQIITFDNQSAPLNNDYTLVWQFGDGQTGSGVSPTHDYPIPGIYDISVEITSPEGCTTDSTFAGFVKINKNPQAGFAMIYDTCVAGPIKFNDTSIPGDYPLTVWTWLLGNANESAVQNPLYGYTEPGTYNISQYVVDAFGCTDSSFQTLSWYPVPRPKVSIKPNRGCVYLEASFDWIAQPINEDYTITWDLGDGTVVVADSLTHFYGAVGNYDIKVSIESPTGCLVDTTITAGVRVLPPPVADFEWSPDSISSIIPVAYFESTSQMAAGWQWDFDNEGFSYLENPVFSFSDTGFQLVTLIVRHPNNCRDTISKWVDIVPEVTYFLPNAFSPNEDGTNELYLGKGITQYIQGFQIAIYDRWGQRVFENADARVGCNGLFDNTGLACEQGMYSYKIRYQKPRGQQYELTGQILLVR
jgi:gliding motility-associated-like protein